MSNAFGGGETRECPTCGGPIKGITTTGPGDHYLSPCGCKVGALGPYARDVAGVVRL